MQRSFLQSRQWADFRASQGWFVHEISMASETIYALERRLPFGQSFTYAPEVWLEDHHNYKDVIGTLAAQIPRGIFFRLEVLNEKNPDITAALETAGFKKAFEQIQPEHRQIIDLENPLDDILKHMKPKGRYNINVARRHGVRVVENAPIESFYTLYAESARRDKFAGRLKQYFTDLLAHFPEQTEVFTAYYHNHSVASALVVFWGDTASYLYGGSSSFERNSMAPSLLHWHIIQTAKHRGMKHYDLLAIAPDDRPHKFAGLRRFKQQFGGRQVDMVGSWDLIQKPGWYTLFRLAEKLRRS